MVATVHVFFDFGGSDTMPGTPQDTNALTPVNIRFKTNDNATIDAIDPIPIPATGSNFSYFKQIYIEVTAGTFTQINNVQFYTDGSNFGTGITTSIADQLPAHTSVSDAGYEVATGTPGTTGDEMITVHAGITTETDAFSFTSACTFAPGDSTAIGEAGNIINAIGESTNYWVVQMEVASTASPGDLADETWTFQYDEI